MQRTDTENNTVEQRQTFRNLFRLLRSGQLLEILKVLRRRLINLLKFIRRILLRLWRSIYEHPFLLKRRQAAQLKRILTKVYSYTDAKKPGTDLTLGLIIRDVTTHPKSSAFIRLIGPLTNNAVSNKISLRLLPENFTDLPEDIDIYIVQRTAFDDEKIAGEFIKALRLLNKVLIVDNDDAFEVIDASHPESNINLDRTLALQLLLKEADQIWLSTRVLKDTASKLNRQSVLIPNTLDDRLWRNPNTKKIKSSNSKKPLHMLYMGTGTHDADIKLLMPALDQVAHKYPSSFKLTVIGVASELPERQWIKRLHVRRSMTLYPNFVKWFLKKGPFDIGLSPLVDNKFNDSKSDIKCLDYIAAGILPVVSDTSAYASNDLNKFIIRVQNSTQAWEFVLSELIKDIQGTRVKIGAIIPDAQKYLWAERSTKVAATKLLDQLKELKASS